MSFHALIWENCHPFHSANHVHTYAKCFYTNSLIISSPEFDLPSFSRMPITQILVSQNKSHNDLFSSYIFALIFSGRFL